MENKNRYKKFGALSSSIDPNRISLTFKSVIPLILAVANLMGWASLDATILDEIAASIVGIVSGFCFLYGIGRKIWVYFSQK